MNGHFGALTLFAALVSPVFACLMREGLRPRVRFGAWSFLGFLGVALAFGWIMRLAGS